MIKQPKHIILRNDDVFCSNCGAYAGLVKPMLIDVFEAELNLFSVKHKTCEKTWNEPQPNPTADEEINANRWLMNGERGISSNTMFSKISGRNVCSKRGFNHPSDPDDFRRCHLLLEFVPQWRNRLIDLRDLSPEWNALVDNWNELTEMLLEQMQTKKANGMYDFMQELFKNARA